MKYIITESKYNDFLDKIIKNEKIEVDYQYFNDTGYDSLTGTVRLYKNGEIFGYRNGYDFFYNFDKRFKTLTYDGSYPHIETLGIFQYLPPEQTIKYFSDNLVSSIMKKNSYLFNK